eukprot:CAMPEP_0171618720 /NCGR_PEP_ID=MMETSP0990-20121206/14924_1 /TAXON_ID=483369 /ORGANISM="non described non described, Strain CCMP2098" /LENGTH=52 /DNA_ID=CAMNT_0012183597 /DNA_START=734 /DNA_END=892 /DNA_ORIENTATION=-
MGTITPTTTQQRSSMATSARRHKRGNKDIGLETSTRQQWQRTPTTLARRQAA